MQAKAMMTCKQAMFGIWLTYPLLSHPNLSEIKPAYFKHHHIRKVMENFPDLTLIAAHMGGIGCEKDVLELLCGQPIYFDTALSGRFSERQPLLYQIMQKHDTSRILYGSDCPWSNQTYEQSFVKNAPISEQAKEDIFWNNAARLLGLSK